MSYSDEYTDKKIAELEKRLRLIYTDAYRKLRDEADNYFEGFQDRYEQEYIKYQEGKYTKQQFIDWQQAQIGRGKRWDALRDSMAERLTKTNVIASQYINGEIPNVFMENYNFQAFEIEQASGMAFNIYNEQTVQSLIVDEPDLFPQSSVNIPKNLRWNEKKLTNALASGIIRGVPLNKLAKEFQSVTDMNRNGAYRSVRTCMNGAQNLGRQKQMEDIEGYAKSKGMKIEKEWVSCEDARVRDSHAQLNGVRVDVNDFFPNGLKYPSDPHGRPEEVYNCRCQQRTVVDGISATRTSNTKETYKAWEKQKLENKSIVKSITLNDIEQATKGTTIRKSVQRQIYKILNQEGYSKYFDEVRVIDEESNVVFNTNVVQKANWGKTILELNVRTLGGKYVNSIDSMFKKAQNTKCNNLKDALTHESYHARLVDMIGFEAYSELEHEKGIAGISTTASLDALESIAEIGVLKERGEYDTLSLEAKVLFERFFKGDIK